MDWKVEAVASLLQNRPGSWPVCRRCRPRRSDLDAVQRLQPDPRRLLTGHRCKWRRVAHHRCHCQYCRFGTGHAPGLLLSRQSAPTARARSGWATRQRHGRYLARSRHSGGVLQEVHLLASGAGARVGRVSETDQSLRRLVRGDVTGYYHPS